MLKDWYKNRYSYFLKEQLNSQIWSKMNLFSKEFYMLNLDDVDEDVPIVMKIGIID